MNLGDVLEEIGKIYPPGLEAHYACQSPNPWDEAHRELEKFIGMEPIMVEVAIEVFYRKCKKLIAEYEAVNKKPAEPVTLSEVFTIGNTTRVEAHESVVRECCYLCQDQTGLSVERAKEGYLRVICRACRAIKENDFSKTPTYIGFRK